jgi:hypothetical protein
MIKILYHVCANGSAYSIRYEKAQDQPTAESRASCNQLSSGSIRSAISTVDQPLGAKDFPQEQNTSLILSLKVTGKLSDRVVVAAFSATSDLCFKDLGWNMRLIHTGTLRLEEFFNKAIPDYAILSHTWGEVLAKKAAYPHLNWDCAYLVCYISANNTGSLSAQSNSGLHAST